MGLRERLEKSRVLPSSGTIMCVRCNAPAATCEHVPAWIRRKQEGKLPAKELVR